MMSESFVLGIGILLVCFTLSTFVLTRIQTDIFPEEYEFKLDPFWYLLGLFLIGAVSSYYLQPVLSDAVQTYTVWTFVLPIVFAALIYFCYLLDVAWLTTLVTYLLALGICFMKPDDFILFPEYLSPWQDKFVVALLILLVSKGLGLLNGSGGIASSQFVAVMITAFLLTYFGVLPQILGTVSLAYLGIMLAFTFLSWPPEKIMISNGAFSALGFILACFMLDASVEFSDASMFIAAAYLFTELGCALYNRFLLQQRRDYLFMNTSYYRLMELGAPEKAIAFSIAKILLVNILLALFQIAAYERLALPIFTVAFNLWLLSILSGDTKPEELLSFSRWGKNAIKGVFAKSKSAHTLPSQEETTLEPEDAVEQEKLENKTTTKKRKPRKKKTLTK